MTLTEPAGTSPSSDRTEQSEASSAPTMRAITQDRFGDADVLHLTAVPRPAPLPTEVLVRVRAAGVNPVDWKTRAGSGMAGVLGAPPVILGWDVSGVVEEVGFGVTTLAAGDEVYGMLWFPRAAGAYAEYVTAPARQFARKPTTVSHEVAAGVPLAALTAWQAIVDTAAVQPGQRVLIHAAAGGVGHLAVQIAKHLGAHVTGTATSRHHAWLGSLGADELIDYTTTRFESVVSDIDVVIDLVGDGYDQTSSRSLEVIRPGGLLVAVPGGVSPELAAAAAERGVRTTPFLVEPDGTALQQIAALIDAGTLHVEVEQVLPLAEAGRAHELGETNRTRGKLVLAVSAETAFLELRRYQVRPRRRTEWVQYMDTVVIPFQQAHGMTVLGSFVDADDEDGYIWIRRFDNEGQREAQYAAVYDSERWQNEIAPAVHQFIDVDRSVNTRAVPTARSLQR